MVLPDDFRVMPADFTSLSSSSGLTTLIWHCSRSTLGRSPSFILGRSPSFILGRSPSIILGRSPSIILGRSPPSLITLVGTGLLRRDSKLEGLKADLMTSFWSKVLYCCFTPHPGRTIDTLSPCPNRPNEIGLLGRTNPRTPSHALSSSWSSPQACRQDTTSRVMLM